MGHIKRGHTSAPPVPKPKRDVLTDCCGSFISIWKEVYPFWKEAVLLNTYFNLHNIYHDENCLLEARSDLVKIQRAIRQGSY